MDSKTKEKSVLNERVRAEKDALLSTTPRLDIERDRILLETYKQTEGYPPVTRRAVFFDRLCSEKTIFIDNHPLVGTLTQYKYGSYALPEIGARWMARLEDKVRLPLGYALLTEEDREWITRSIEYWKDTSIFERTKDIISKTHGVNIGLLQKCGVGTELTPGGLMEGYLDFPKVLSVGLKGIIAEIEEEQSRLDVGDPEGFGKLHFYEATSLCLKAMIKLAGRYSDLASEMARGESDAERKRELEEIAKRCERVPANSARDFRDAIQSVWFVTLGPWFENPATGNCGPLRFDQYMYPFYKRDKEQGKLTDEEAIEFMQFFFLKLQSLGQVLPPFGFRLSQSRVALHLCLAGLTPDGHDATNELSYLVIDAKKQLNIPEPLVAILYHNELKEDFLLKGVDLIKTGMGQPAFYDMGKIIQRRLHYSEGITLAEARNAAIIPCVQDIVPGYTDGFWEGFLNCAKFVELALNNGKDPLTGAQVGPQTGNPESFATYEQFYEAFLQQMRYFVPLARVISRVAWNVARSFPIPFSSALVNDCVKKGKDLVDGGARYSLGNGTIATGVIDAANSLAAIKTLVFEDNKITIKELKKALTANFEGYEEIYSKCLGAPKYGNGEENVDSIVQEIFNIFADEHDKFPDFLGRPIMPEALSATAHVPMGEATGALPCGRKANLPITDASVSAQPGTDKNGPTALIKSAAKAVDTVRYGSNHLNMKFHPSSMRDTELARKFLALIRTYVDLGGYHVQFNCVSGETLKEAQLHPEEYKNLIVRVAGYSAYFVTLDPDLQDEIIRRTELMLS